MCFKTSKYESHGVHAMEEWVGGESTTEYVVWGSHRPGSIGRYPNEIGCFDTLEEAEGLVKGAVGHQMGQYLVAYIKSRTAYECGCVDDEEYVSEWGFDEDTQQVMEV